MNKCSYINCNLDVDKIISEIEFQVNKLHQEKKTYKASIFYKSWVLNGAKGNGKSAHDNTKACGQKQKCNNGIRYFDFFQEISLKNDQIKYGREISAASIRDAASLLISSKNINDALCKVGFKDPKKHNISQRISAFASRDNNFASSAEIKSEANIFINIVDEIRRKFKFWDGISNHVIDTSKSLQDDTLVLDIWDIKKKQLLTG